MREYRDSIKGMATFVNRSSDDERSDKSLILAENCTMRRPGVLEQRDGVLRSAAMGGAVAPASVLLPCPKEQSAALISYSGTGGLTRYKPSTDTWTAYTTSGAYSGAPTPYGDYQFDGSLVLASFFDGVVEIGGLAEPYMSGVEAGKWYYDQVTNPQPVTLNAGGSWLPNNRRAAFKVTYLFKTFNNTWEEGAPSSTLVIENATGGARGVNFKVSWPKTANFSGGRVFRVRIYTTALADATTTTIPNDAYYYLLYESQDYTPPQATFSTVSILTISSTSIALYTNADQSGGAKARFRPPRATTVKSLGDLTFYTGFAGRGRPSYQVTPKSGFESFWSGSSRHSGINATFVGGNATVNMTVGTVTAADVGLSLGRGGTVSVIPQGAYIIQINSPTQFVMNVPAGAGAVGMAFELFDTISINGTRYSTEVTVTANAGFTAIGLDIWANIGVVNVGLIGVAERCNSDTGNAVTCVAATENINRATDGLPSFAVTSLLVESDTPSAALTVTSTNSTQIDITDLNAFPNNQVLYAEPGLPYAVPLINVLTVGSPNSTPSGIGVYKEIAYIFQMGRIYTLTGADESSLSLLQTDTEYYVQNQQGIAVGEQGCYAYSNKGIIRVGQGGVEVISNMVTDLLPYWGTLSYDREHRELTCIPNSANTAWMVFSERTGMWTKTIPPLTTPGAMPSNFKVIQCWEGTPLNGEPYVAYSDTASGRVWVQPERTVITYDSFTGTVPTVSAWSSPTLTLNSTTGLAPGFVLSRTNGGNTEWAVIESVVSSTVVTVRTLTTAGPGFSAGGALGVYAAFLSRVRFQPFDMTDASNTYAFAEVQLLLQRHAFDNTQLIFQTDLSTATESLDLLETGEVNAFWRLRKFNKATSSPLTAPQDDYEPWDDWGGRWMRALMASNGRQGSQVYVEWDTSCAFQRWRLLGVAVTAADVMAEVGRRTAA